MTEQQILEKVDQIVAAGPYAPTWESLSQAPVPQWFRQRRLGIFIHWGLYSVPAFGSEWYSRNMYIPEEAAYQHHIKTYGAHKDFGYKDFIPMFKAEKFDAGAWAKLFRKAGAGYVMPVAEHHDGFQMYRSDLSKWNAAEMGPHKDLIGQWKAAVEEEGMEFCTSTHRAEHWFFMGQGKKFDSDVKDPMVKGDFYWPAMPEMPHFDKFSQPMHTEEYLNDWLARTAEIILNYQPKLLYFDWWIQHSSFKPYLKKLAAFYYNCGKQWGQDVMICYKQDAMMFGTGIVEVERGSLEEAKPYAWQTDTAVARNSWCHTNALDYKESWEIVTQLVDIVSKGGNLLLNVGPKADGSIPDGDRKILEDLGAWMDVNGEAIHGTGCWRVFAEGPTRTGSGQFQDSKQTHYTSADYRFTAGHGAVYAVCLKCPKDGTFTVRALSECTNHDLPVFQGIIEKVSILGYDGVLTWRQDAQGLHISAPGIHSDFPVTIRAELM
jgi:alpha-L-fucosidase